MASWLQASDALTYMWSPVLVPAREGGKRSENTTHLRKVHLFLIPHNVGGAVEPGAVTVNRSARHCVPVFVWPVSGWDN